MMETLRSVLEGALERFNHDVTTDLPSLLAALTLLLGAYLTAVLVRRVVYRTFKGLSTGKFPRRSGIAFMVDSSGRLSATRLEGETGDWGILLSGVLAGVNVFGADVMPSRHDRPSLRLSVVSRRSGA